MSLPLVHFNVVSLIGMPGSGKSTVGPLVAMRAGLDFSDTDLMIESHEGMSLQEIVDRKGYRYLRRLEEAILLQLPLARSVVATGGSVIYSAAVMRRLCAAGPVVYLQADLATIVNRVAIAPLRGIASDSVLDIAEIYQERTPLYQRYATHTIETTGKSPRDIAANIVERV